MPAKLTFYPPHRARRLAVVWEGECLDLGREPGSEVQLDDPRVSRRHARLQWTGSGWRVEDLGSRNGTLVNGAPPAAADLKDGDILDLGGLEGRFERLTAAQAVTLDADRLARAHTSAELRRRLNEELRPGELLRRLLEAAREVTRTERGFVLTFRADGTLRAMASSGFTAEDLGADRFRGSVTAVRQALDRSAAVIVADVHSDPGLGKRPSVVAAGIGSLACIPLRFEGETLGVIYVDSRKLGPAFTELDLETLEFLAEHAARLLGTTSAGSPANDSTDAVEIELTAKVEERIAQLLPAV
jgi:hypothetical protein